MKKIVLYVLLLFYAQSFAQGIQMNQTPLLYHPSFAGSTGGGRLAFSTQGFQEKEVYDYSGLLGGGLLSGYNYSTLEATFRKDNLFNYLSFDHLWKGIGWGVVLKNQDLFYSLSHFNKTQKSSRFINGIDFIVSPKFILRNNKGAARFTLSPSLSLGYTQENPDLTTKNFTYFENGVPSIYNRPIYLSSDFGKWGYGYNNPKVINSSYQATFGIMLNTSKTYIGLTYQHTTSVFKVVEERRYYALTDTSSTLYKSETLNARYYTASHSVLSLVTGRTLKRREDSKFSFSYQFYLGFGIPYKKYEDFGTTHFLQNISLNLNATYGRFYLGVGGTERPVRNASLFAGYQSKRMRLGITYGWRVDQEPQETKKTIAGLSASFFFPK